MNSRMVAPRFPPALGAVNLLVSSSWSSEEAEGVRCPFLYALLFVGDSGTCDSILLRKALVDVDKGTGAITWRAVDLRRLVGRCH